MARHKILIAIIGISIITAFWITYVTLNPDQNGTGMMKFLSVYELRATQESSRVRLGGKVASGSIIISATDKLDASFALAQGKASIPVKFYGTRPDLFKDDAEIIVEGNYHSGMFNADQLQVKCASRYEGTLRDESSYNLDEL